MFDAIRERLEDVQRVHERLPDAAIALATELRRNVRRNRRRAAGRRRVLRVELKFKGSTPAQVRVALAKGRRGGSGISIDGNATADAVRVTASSQVQHLRREQDETADLKAIFAEHMHIAIAFRRRGGG